jgi:hypothetical protein
LWPNLTIPLAATSSELTLPPDLEIVSTVFAHREQRITSTEAPRTSIASLDEDFSEEEEDEEPLLGDDDFLDDLLTL